MEKEEQMVQACRTKSLRELCGSNRQTCVLFLMPLSCQCGLLGAWEEEEEKFPGV
jgi:hypothetical protein